MDILRNSWVWVGIIILVVGLLVRFDVFDDIGWLIGVGIILLVIGLVTHLIGKRRGGN